MGIYFFFAQDLKHAIVLLLLSTFCREPARGVNKTYKNKVGTLWFINAALQIKFTSDTQELILLKVSINHNISFKLLCIAFHNLYDTPSALSGKRNWYILCVPSPFL